MQQNNAINQEEEQQQKRQDYVNKLRFCIMTCCKSQLSKDYLRVFSLE